MSLVPLKNYFEHHDERGSIRGLVNQYSWGEINFIESDSNQTRGNHYHKESMEFFYIISGKIEVTTYNMDPQGNFSDKQTILVEAGSAFLVEPLTLHVFNILEPASWVNAMSPRMNPESPDIHTPS